ncbi:MAG TPA: cysteine protease StiP family protein [Nitrococcus sp.]|nr:cysteine protease StiP family protein [Nitrococcus sp.]
MSTGRDSAASLVKPITGSYRASDCQFMLTPLNTPFTDLVEKERMIQRGQRHYSEMISREHAPSAQYFTLFKNLTARYKVRLATEVLALARHIIATRPAPITIVSLARAGTPFGALLQRALTEVLAVDSVHYSISIIRDRGIDTVALRYILRDIGRPAPGVLFADAWTAKGVITRELKAAIKAWNRYEPEQLSDELYVISDIGGTADVAATYEDYAIPCGILNATVCGLVSRSILNEEIGEHEFHGCVVYDDLRAHDLTNWFLDEVSAEFTGTAGDYPLPSSPKEARASRARSWIERWMAHYGIADVNYIKPGIAEATRVLLRRVPQRLLLRDPTSSDVRHLRVLAEEKGVPIAIEPAMPFNAAAFIRAC